MWITPSFDKRGVPSGVSEEVMEVIKLRFIERTRRLIYNSNISYQGAFSGYNCVIIPEVDTKDCINFSRMFYNCYNLVTIPQLDTSNGTNFSLMFGGCNKLITIPQLDISNGTNFNDMFHGCYSLENITIEGTIKVSSNDLRLSNCSRLTVDSIMSFINAFEDNTGEETQYTVTFGATNLAKLTEDQIAVATNKNILLA